MPALLNFVSGEGHDAQHGWWNELGNSGTKFSKTSTLVLCGTKNAVKERFGAIVRQFKVDTHESSLSMALENAKASDLSGACIRSHGTRGDDLVQIYLLLLPTTASRHNAPARPDVLYKLADNISGGGRDECVRCDVVICCGDGNSAPFSLGCAFSRAFPLYSRKSNATNTPSDLAMCISFWNTASNGPVTDAAVLRRVHIASESIRAAARLVDMPCLELNTTAFVREVRHAIEQLSHTRKHMVGIETIEGKELEERGFGGIYGVGKGAKHPPALVVCTYAPENAKRRIAWVGKGIVFDTGGLNIKSNMLGMKRDMGGAAAIFQAFVAAVKLQPTDVHLTAVLCLAENAVGPDATRPDDIHTLYSGKTVEINNTDAEGRLVLGDGVAYVTKHCSPDVVLDMCTLTGAQGTATGRRHGAVITNSEEMESLALRAGRQSGDLTWALPYCPELFTPEFSSVVADMKNSVKDRGNAQPSCAAQFIANHLAADYKGAWVHVDMAAPVYSGERATGYGVALLLDMFVSS